MTDYSIDIIKNTSYTIELNEQGPQGIQGERGIQGPEGPVGPKGDKGDIGEKGDTGVSVVGVEEISKVGLVTTYRMEFSDGTHFDYQVTDGSIDGLTRETIINIIGYEPASYTSVEGLTTRVSTLEESLASRANVSLNNLDEVGEKRFTDIQIALDGKQDKGTSGSGLELCDIGVALYVDETKGLRRYLNGQIVDINTNTQAFLNRLLKIQTTNQDYFTTEENWQAEKTMNIDGCVYKFVLNYDSTGTNVISVRLPKYPDYIEINNNSINNTAPVAVYGNGLTLGLTNGSATAGLSASFQESVNYPQTVMNYTSLYGVRAGTASPSNASRAGIHGVSLGVTTNPSYSGLTGTATITSNFRQTKLKLRYFIQIATGQETENNIVNEIELNTPSFFGDSKYVPTKVNNLSWLKSEGQNNSKGTYPSFYDWILENVNKGEKGFKLSTATDITDYDFVINTTDETFRLPLLNGVEVIPSDIYTFNIIPNNITPTQQNYTAPANGWVYIKGHQTTGGSMYAHIRTPFGVETSCLGAGVIVNSSFKRFVKRGDTLVVWSDVTSFNDIVSYFQYAQGNGSLYYYVGETVQNANLIDAGRIGEVLANKQDKCIHIIDTYVNGTSGYRIWSDGYCEQWGRVSATTQTVKFLKAFANTSYCITGGLIPGNSAATYEHLNIGSLTTTSFYYSCYDGYQLMWKACGYLAEGEY